MKACILLNGEVDNLNYIKDIIDNNDYRYIICADGGAKHLYKLNIVPNYIIGDLDSLEESIINYYKNKGVDFKKFPKRKDETDAQLCIHLAKDLKVSEIHLLGALGGRIDHTIANINLMYYIKELGVNPIIKSKVEDIYMIDSEFINIMGKRGDIISIIPSKGDVSGVTLKNLEYPLENATIKYGNPIGISNVMKSNQCSIKVKNGCLIIVRNKIPK
ncbi:thiamine diphosphokinase [[Eubacterium] tenue]|nr:thiamine diphosphokinase [[Eubacterium] tenue]MBC8631044.1 thiamine diphosphokinase [[Eubacterium] tenue]